jgi:hypothetical protein
MPPTWIYDSTTDLGKSVTRQMAKKCHQTAWAVGHLCASLSGISYYKTTLIHTAEARLGHESPNVIHMSLRPRSALEEEENGKGGKGSGRNDEEATAGCRCVIL